MLIYKLVALESAIIITFLFFTFSHVPFQKTCQRHKFSVISISVISISDISILEMMDLTIIRNS